MFCYIAGPGFPCGGHGLLTDHRFLANRTAVVEASQLPEAVRMNGVSTRQVLRRLPRGKHIFSAYRAVVFVLVFQALVRFKDSDGNAHATLIAVAKRLHPSHTTETALIAVKGFLTLGNKNRHNSAKKKHKMQAKKNGSSAQSLPWTSTDYTLRSDILRIMYGN